MLYLAVQVTCTLALTHVVALAIHVQPVCSVHAKVAAPYTPPPLGQSVPQVGLAQRQPARATRPLRHNGGYTQPLTSQVGLLDQGVSTCLKARQNITTHGHYGSPLATPWHSPTPQQPSNGSRNCQTQQSAPSTTTTPDGYGEPRWHQPPTPHHHPR